MYGFVDNQGVNEFDSDGLEKGAQAMARLGRDSKSALGDLQINPLRGLQLIIGLPFSVLSGDALYRAKLPIVDKGNCNVLITVNGILNEESDRKNILTKAGSAPRFAGAQPFMAVNSTAGHLFGWLTDPLQIIGDELGAIQTASVQLARQLNSVYDQFKANGCCCATVHVLAHSQGTMVFRRAWPLIKKDARSLIHYTGIGGETTIQGSYGLAAQENYANYTGMLNRDWVPVMGNVLNPLRIPSYPFVGFPEWTSVKPENSNWMEHGYNKFYDGLIQSLEPNGACIPIK